MARPDKIQAVKDIAGRFTETDAVLLTEYRGLRVGDIAEVRNALRESQTDYKVLKNTLTRLAVREVGLEDLVALLEGPTAIAFVKGDVATAAKALDDAAKKFPVLTIKGGVLNGKIIDAEQARQLAKLEPREVLLAKIAMLFNAPAQQTVNVFSALLRDLGSMLAQVIAKKESGELPGGTGEVAPETPAAEPEVEEAEKTAEAVQPETEQKDEAEAAAEEAEPPAETAEAVEQAAAAPESEEAETQETTESGSKEEDR
ncbi:MAG: 50S ribosomal protein L10 [Actinomycetota bacterium]